MFANEIDPGHISIPMLSSFPHIIIVVFLKKKKLYTCRF